MSLNVALGLRSLNDALGLTSPVVHFLEMLWTLK